MTQSRTISARDAGAVCAYAAPVLRTLAGDGLIPGAHLDDDGEWVFDYQQLVAFLTRNGAAGRVVVAALGEVEIDK